MEDHVGTAKEKVMECRASLSDGAEAAPPPVGDISLVFTDIKDSTVLWETSMEGMRSALALHNEIIRRTIKTHGGYEVKVIGDAFMIAFASAASALVWCLAVQKELLHAEWPKEILETPTGKEIRDKDGNFTFRGFSVRMGMHHGKPIDKDDEVTGRKDYIGPAVHRAARTIEMAEGGQIVVSHEFLVESQSTGFTDKEEKQSTDGEVTGPEASRQSFIIRDLGKHDLKGLSDSLHLYMIIPESLRGRLEQFPRQYSSFAGIWNWMSK